MALPALALGSSVGLGAFKAFSGARQQSRARRIRRRAQKEFDENPFRTPAEALQSLESAKTQAAQTRLPGEDIFTSQIQSATGGAMQATREAAVTPQDIMGAATRNYEALYVNPLRNLRVSAAQRSDRNQDVLRNQLGNVAQFRKQEWQQNVLAPYQAAMGTAGQLASAGQQNLFGGISDIVGGAANFGLAGGFGGGQIDKSATATGIAAPPRFGAGL